MTNMFTLRYEKAFPAITSVSASQSAISAVYEQPTQTWIDTFSTRGNLSKIGGTNALLSPSDKNIATIRNIIVHPSSQDHAHTTTLTVRDTSTGKTIVDIKGAKRSPVAWRADSKAIAAATETENQLAIWDISSGQQLTKVVAHYDEITHAAFLDSNIVTMSRDGTLRITNSTNGKTIAKLEVEGIPRLLGVSSRGQIVSVWSGFVYIWFPGTNQVTSYKLAAVRDIEGWPLDVSPDGRYIVNRTEDGFDVMEVSTGQTVFTQPMEKVTSAVFTQDTLIVGGQDGIQVWDF